MNFFLFAYEMPYDHVGPKGTMDLEPLGLLMKIIKEYENNKRNIETKAGQETE